MCIFKAIGLGRIIPLSLQAWFIFAMIEYEANSLTIFLRETDTRLVFMLKCAGQESMNTAQKVFQ